MTWRARTCLCIVLSLIAGCMGYTVVVMWYQTLKQDEAGERLQQFIPVCKTFTLFFVPRRDNARFITFYLTSYAVFVTFVYLTVTHVFSCGLFYFFKFYAVSWNCLFANMMIIDCWQEVCGTVDTFLQQTFVLSTCHLHLHPFLKIILCLDSAYANVTKHY